MEDPAQKIRKESQLEIKRIHEETDEKLKKLLYEADKENRQLDIKTQKKWEEIEKISSQKVTAHTKVFIKKMAQLVDINEEFVRQLYKKYLKKMK